MNTQVVPSPSRPAITPKFGHRSCTMTVWYCGWLSLALSLFFSFSQIHTHRIVTTISYRIIPRVLHTLFCHGSVDSVDLKSQTQDIWEHISTFFTFTTRHPLIPPTNLPNLHVSRQEAEVQTDDDVSEPGATALPAMPAMPEASPEAQARIPEVIGSQLFCTWWFP